MNGITNFIPEVLFTWRSSFLGIGLPLAKALHKQMLKLLESYNAFSCASIMIFTDFLFGAVSLNYRRPLK